MKVLYVVPNWKLHKTKYTSVSIYAPNSIPLEFLYVVPQLNSDIETKIIDANLYDLGWDELEEKIYLYEPDVIIFNTTLNYILWRCPPVEFEIPKKLMNICKKVNASTIAIGPHSVVDAEEVYNEIGVDFLIIGEPETVLARFLNSYLKDLDIKGIFTNENTYCIADEVDLHKLPIPNLDLIDIVQYEPHMWSNKTTELLKNLNIRGTILEFTRGCIYHCPYCFRKGFRDKFRRKDIKQIEKEIKYVKSKGIGYIYFIDEIFNIDSPELRQLLMILKKEDMKFGCQARPDIMSYELIDIFKESGCIYIEYGVESLSEEVLRAINKNLDINYVKKIIAYSYHVFGKDNVEPGWINFYTKDIKKILGLKNEDKWGIKVVRPYPNSIIGDEIFKLYNIKNNKWNFLLRYLWWSQVENLSVFFGDTIDEKVKSTILFGDIELSQNTSYYLIENYMNKMSKKK